MRSNLIIGAAALALMTGSAVAQNTTTIITTPNPAPAIMAPAPATTSQTTTTSQNSLTGAVSQSKEVKTIDSDGREVQKSESYDAGPGHTDRSVATTVKNPDGSVSTSQQKVWSNQPAVTQSTTSTTTTVGQ